MAVLKLVVVFTVACLVGATPFRLNRAAKKAPREDSKDLLKRTELYHKSNTPPFIMDIYRKLEHEDEEARGSAKVLKFFHAQKFENQEYHFNISSISPYTTIRAAEIYLFARKPGSIPAYDVTSGHVISRQTLPLGHSGWTEFNITSLFREWLQNPQKSWGIHLPEDNGLSPELYPWLVVYTDYENHVATLPGLRGMGQRKPLKRRRRRHPESDVTDDPDVRDGCKRSAMYVSFSDIGMDNFIIAPHGYNAYRCGGACTNPIPRESSTTNHAIIQSLVHVHTEQVEEPCCVPVSLSPITILYLDDDNNVVLKKFLNMVVNKCGCH